MTDDRPDNDFEDDNPPPPDPNQGGFDLGAEPEEPTASTQYEGGENDDGPGSAYRVLARAYRPSRFEDLIGQEAMVRTLRNAIASGRLAHAYILTGVRGVGKTTTARIIARAFNCVGADGKGGPTATPCGVCSHCTAIAEDRHVDVVEMDAASRTGINDIRELIESARYRPLDARYKIFIIDEVHMLSNAAFNGLLKTLEEPPEHVKFIFATTEIRRLPVTVLSRCQRFDLRRVSQEALEQHFTGIAEKEGAVLEPDAAAMIARAADGSVRDGLSILDQAIALTEGPVTGDLVREMLGLADRHEIFRLLDEVLQGEPAKAVARLGRLYDMGQDPVVAVRDLLELTHWLTRLKLAPKEAERGAPELERTEGRRMADNLAIPALARLWQMLLKGLGEVQAAPSSLQAAEMLLVRIAHAADLPSPADLVRQLEEGRGSQAAGAERTDTTGGRPVSGGETASGAASRDRGAPSASASAVRSAPTLTIAARSGGGAAAAIKASGDPYPALAGEARPQEDRAPTDAVSEADGPPGDAVAAAGPMPAGFSEMVELFASHREGRLYGHLFNDAHMIRFEPGHVELRFDGSVPRGIVQDIARRLGEWTGRNWFVSQSEQEGEPTLREQRTQKEEARLSTAAEHPLVKAALETFPGARVASVRDLVDPADQSRAGGADDGAPYSEQDSDPDEEGNDD